MCSQLAAPRQLFLRRDHLTIQAAPQFHDSTVCKLQSLCSVSILIHIRPDLSHVQLLHNHCGSIILTAWDNPGHTQRIIILTERTYPGCVSVPWLINCPALVHLPILYENPPKYKSAKSFQNESNDELSMSSLLLHHLRGSLRSVN